MRLVFLFLLLGAVAACDHRAASQDVPGSRESGGSGGSGGSGSGGGGAGGDGIACIPGGQALAVTPADGSATVTGSGESFAFQAEAVTTGGTRNVTGKVRWSVAREDDSPAGTIDAAGVFTPPAGTGGRFVVSATDGCISGQATFTVRLEARFGDPDPTTVDRFDAGAVDTTTSDRLPLVVYPQDETRFPRNIYKVLFQWRKAGSSTFRLTFEGPYSTTTVFTDGVHDDCASNAEAACWQADATTWQAIAGSNAGAVTHLTIDGIGDGESTVHRAPSIDIGFSKRDVKGAIFYWSTTSAGIRRASVSDSAPEAYVVGKPVPTVLPTAGRVKCVACHTVSRSGKKIVAYTQAGSTGEFVYDVTPEPPPAPIVTTQISTQKGFGTFSPDDSRVVATVGDLLAEFDAATGEKIASLPVAVGTNPDWSPTGTELVYSDAGGDSPGNAGLKVIERQDGVWGSIRTLAAASGKTNLFPSYSPDGSYVAYARGKGGHGDKTFQLFLTRSDGSEDAVELLNANRSVNNCLGVVCDGSGRTNGQYENNMPTWAPQGDLLWIAFNSRRPYGEVYPDGGTQQIWVAAIDPAKLGQRDAHGDLLDPSYPAFRFAFQDLAENNHRAYWTLDVRDPDPGGSCVDEGDSCTAETTCCAGLTCLPAGELDYTCQEPDPGGTCIQPGDPCDQTSGDPCCDGSWCDVGPDGGTQCIFVEIK